MPHASLRACTTAFLLATLLTAGSATAEPRRLDFEWETQNVPVVNDTLEQEPPPGVEIDCDDLTGAMLFGAIPHRLIGETMDRSAHFVSFAAVYPSGAPARLVIDRDHDRKLECGEQVELIRHPAAPETLFRTVIVKWDDEGPERSRRYRLKIPSTTTGETPRFAIDLVDVPVARLTQGDRSTQWILHDGNYDGLFGGNFGDGMLVDAKGSGQFDLSSRGESFRSFFEPIRLPWGAVRISEVDRAGRFVTLAPIDAGDLEPALGQGDVAPPLRCETIEGEPLHFGGASGRHQVLFFWVSTCGTCFADVQDLLPLARGIGAERLSVVGVSMDEERERSRRFAAETGADWPNCYSGRVLWDNDLARRFEVETPSEFVVLDPHGRVIARGSGINVLEGILDEHVVAPVSRADASEPDLDDTSELSGAP